MTAANGFAGVRRREGTAVRFVLVDRTEGLLNRRSGHQPRTGPTFFSIERRPSKRFVSNAALNQ
jgi:hypothetical protein